MGYLEEMLRKAKEERVKKKGKRLDEKPSITALEVEVEVPREGKVLLESYQSAKIYRVKGEPLYLYEVPVPHYRGEEKKLINSLVEISTSVIELVSADFGTEEERRAKYYQRIMDIIEASPELSVPVNAKEFYANAVVKEMVGYGLIDDLVKDDFLEDILVLGPGKPTYVYHGKYGMMKTNVVFYDDKDIRDLIERIARLVGRRIDFQVPMLDARLPDGTRVNATIPPISFGGSTISLRKFRKDPLTVIDLVGFNTLNFELAAFLWLAVDGHGTYPANILISGGTASGKTTTLNVLCSFIPSDERIITVEDTLELNLPLPHWIRFESRPPGLEGTGEISMDDLVKNSLRMRPDRIIVGEIRGPEGFTLFSAINTGHRGSFGTVHANSANETLVRLASPPISVPPIMLTPLNFILMQNRIFDKKRGVIRRITEVAELVGMDGDKPQLQILWQWDPIKDSLEPTGSNSFYLRMLSRFTGLGKKELDEELKARQAILRDLSKKGVRKLEGVCAVTQGYILKRKAL